MGFGLYKKLKEQVKKIKPWIKKALPAARKVIDTATPIITDIFKNKPKYSKVNDLLSITSDGLEAADEAINYNNYDKTIDWTKKNLAPKLKNKSLF